MKNKQKPKQTKKFSDNEIALFKSKTLFLRGDFAVYISLLFCIVLLFIFFVFPTQNNKNDVFLVSHNNQTVLAFTFSKTNPIEISDNYVNLTQIEERENGFKITVYLSENKSAYNVIFVDTEKLINSTMVVEAETEDLREALRKTEEVTDIPEVAPVEAVEEKVVEIKEPICAHDFEALKGGVHKVIKGIPHYYKKFKCKKCGLIEEKRV